MSNELQSATTQRAANGLIHIGNAGEIWTPSCSLISLLCRAGRTAIKAKRRPALSRPAPVMPAAAMATEAA